MMDYMDICCGCDRPIRFWQATGFNTSWHKQCTESWERGYKAAIAFAENENRLLGVASPNELYSTRNKNAWKKLEPSRQ